MRFYHGTTTKIADQIFSDRHFKFSKNEYDWLGSGVYFYQEAPLKALAWAQKFSIDSENRGTTPAVIEVEFDLSKVFDLFKPENFEFLRIVDQKYSVSDRQRTQKRPVLRTHEGNRFRVFHNASLAEAEKPGANFIDCTLINKALQLLREMNQEYDCVRHFFWEGQELYKGSYFYDHSNIQLCVIGAIGVLDFGDPIFRGEPSLLQLSEDNLNWAKSKVRWPV